MTYDVLKWGFYLWVLHKMDPGARARLNAMLAAYEQQQRIQAVRNALANVDVRQAVNSALSGVVREPVPPPKQPLEMPPDPRTVEAAKWLRVIRHPSVILILGGRGKGKSALGYWLLECLRWTAAAYVVGVPKEGRGLLPAWIGMAARLEDVPPNSIALVDEAYLHYHARGSMAAEAKAMSQLVNLSRQREQTIFFVSGEARQLDRNIASSANVVVFKDVGPLQPQFDRPELNKLAQQAGESFAVVKGDRRRWAYVYAPDADFAGLVENSLPSFWNEKLSRVFAAGGDVAARLAVPAPLAQRIEKAKQLREQGLSLGQIATMMGVSKPTVKNYLEGYPYKDG